MLTAGSARASWWDALAAASRPSGEGPYVPTASTNLVAWWTFNSGSGAYQADMSGNGNYLTQETASAYAAISNGAAYFAGGDYFRTPTTSFMNGAGSYTITAWLFLTSINDYSGFVTIRGAAYTGLASYEWAGKKIYTYHNSANISATALYPSGTWFFVASSYVTNQLSDGHWQSVNGTMKSRPTTSESGIVVDDYWQVGREDFGTRWITSGFIDDVRFYNRNLTTNEINAVQAEERK
jgi:hypothetical protein